MVIDEQEDHDETIEAARGLFTSVGAARNKAETMLIREMQHAVIAIVNAREHEQHPTYNLKHYDYWHGQVAKHMAILDAFRFAIVTYRTLEDSTMPPE